MIGRSLVGQLSKKQVKTILVVRPGTNRGYGFEDNPYCEIVPCDLSDLGKLAEEISSGKRVLGSCADGCDAFFHLGWSGTVGEARENALLQLDNVGYTLDAVALAEALKSKTFVGAGSQAEYGRVEGIIGPNDLTKPENAYGVSKLAAGHLSRIACAKLDIRHVWMRIFSIYGPYDNACTMVSSVIRSLLKGARPSLTPAEQTWDYLFAGDAARALILAAEKGKTGSIYCVGSGEASPLREYIEIIRDEIDPCAPLGIGERPYADKQVMHLCADTSSLSADTGFSPSVSFREGIRLTIDWMKAFESDARSGE